MSRNILPEKGRYERRRERVNASRLLLRAAPYGLPCSTRDCKEEALSSNPDTCMDCYKMDQHIFHVEGDN